MTAVTKMVEPFALNAPTDGSPGGKTVPFPVPSQIPLGSPGAASLTDGFTPLNMTALSSGGIPMSGLDLNGILYLMSTTIAALNAGLAFLPYDSVFQTAIGGYPIGAKVQQAADSNAIWTSTTAANVTDPDTGGAGWLSSKTLYSAAALTGVNDVVLPGPSDYIIDVATAKNFTGFVAQRDDQKITFCQTTSGTVQFTSLATSAAGNQLRIPPAGIALSQYDSYTIQYNATLAKWVPV
jgi:hypothetical protein